VDGVGGIPTRELCPRRAKLVTLSAEIELDSQPGAALAPVSPEGFGGVLLQSNGHVLGNKLTRPEARSEFK
jgi:hypothetical protein